MCDFKSRLGMRGRCRIPGALVSINLQCQPLQNEIPVARSARPLSRQRWIGKHFKPRSPDTRFMEPKTRSCRRPWRVGSLPPERTVRLDLQRCAMDRLTPSEASTAPKGPRPCRNRFCQRETAAPFHPCASSISPSIGDRVFQPLQLLLPARSVGTGNYSMCFAPVTIPSSLISAKKAAKR